MFPENSILITFRNSYCPSFLPLLWIWWLCFLVGGQHYFWHRQRSTIYYLPSQCIWLNLRHNLKQEVQFHETESFLLHTSVLLGWEQVTGHPQCVYIPFLQILSTAPAWSTFEQPRTAAENTAAEISLLLLGQLIHDTPLLWESFKNLQESGCRLDEIPWEHWWAVTCGAGETCTGIAQLSPLKQFTSPQPMTEGKVFSFPYRPLIHCHKKRITSYEE